MDTRREQLTMGTPAAEPLGEAKLGKAGRCT
jgi:hypothetical protein